MNQPHTITENEITEFLSTQRILVASSSAESKRLYYHVEHNYFQIEHKGKIVQTWGTAQNAAYFYSTLGEYQDSVTRIEISE